MPPEFSEVVRLLELDVSGTVGDSHRHVVRDTAGRVLTLERTDRSETLVEDVQQQFHDTFVDPSWPACPRHVNHPLWYKDGAWWCEKDGVAIARLGELRQLSRPAG